MSNVTSPSLGLRLGRLVLLAVYTFGGLLVVLLLLEKLVPVPPDDVRHSLDSAASRSRSAGGGVDKCRRHSVARVVVRPYGLDTGAGRDAAL